MEIDAIIAWVDGGDPAHRAGRARFGDGVATGAAGDARFACSGEIYLCLASILKFAPWIRRIVIVTDDQRPALLDTFVEAGLCSPGRFEIVDHDAIFAGTDAARPTFSSLTIEAALHRIPGLAPGFVYFNDDMLLTAPATARSFFRDDGMPVLHGTWTRPTASRPRKRAEAALRALLNRPARRSSHLLSQELSARLAGWHGPFLRTPHAPAPVRTELAACLERDHPDRFAAQLAHRFRDPAQYNPVALVNHAELLGGLATDGPLDIAYLRPGSPSRIGDALARIARGDVRSACLQSLERMRPDLCRSVLHTLTARLASHLPPDIAAALRDGT